MVKNVEWVNVDSSNLKKIAFKNDVLYVWFRSDSIYQYSNVQVSIYNDILNKKCLNMNGVPSCGATFYELVRRNSNIIGQQVQ